MVVGGKVVSISGFISFSVNEKVVWGGEKVVVPDVFKFVVLNEVEVVGLRVVVVIQAF